MATNQKAGGSNPSRLVTFNPGKAIAMPIINPIPVEISPDEAVRVLRLDRRAGGEEQARKLWIEAAALFRTRAFFRETFIESRTADTVTIEGRVFRSRVLRVNTDRAFKVFAYVLTIGADLEARAARSGDLLHRYYLETLADSALAAAVEEIREHIGRETGLDRLSGMSPGSLEDWPITEQIPLFDLLGDVESEIGVRLTDSLLMIPRKSVSGVFFPSKETFLSCRLCSRQPCPGRKATFDPELRERYREEKD